MNTSLKNYILDDVVSDCIATITSGREPISSLFVQTICTHNKQSLFGNIVDNRMSLNPYGVISDSSWKDIPRYYLSEERDIHNHAQSCLWNNRYSGLKAGGSENHPWSNSYTLSPG